MKILITLPAMLIAGLTIGSPAFASAGATHNTCNSQARVQVRDMGSVDEATLQAHIDRAEKDGIMTSGMRGSQAYRRVALKRHLDDMHSAMDQLHVKMYKEGCTEALHGLPLETRVNILEKELSGKGGTSN